MSNIEDTIYDLPNEEYHKGEKFKDFLSSTQIKDYMVSPKFARYKALHPEMFELSIEASEKGPLYHDAMESLVNTGTLDKWRNNLLVFEPPINPKTGCPYGRDTQKYQIALIEAKESNPGKTLTSTTAQVREKVNNKFETTIRNRVNSRKTPIIIIMQRLDEDDLCGYLQRLEPDEWTVLSLPVIETGEDGKEHALWEFKHTLQELYNLREKNVYVFDTQYMQNPTPLTGLMYEREFKTYEVQPVTRKRKIKAYIDTADTGADFLCCIIYLETEIGNFIIDVYYTQAAMETTEPETARRLTKYKVEEAIIESNNGGRGFSRNVEAQCRILGNRETSFTWFHQSENKEVRIFNHSAEVQNLTYFPKGWEHLFPQFYKAITQYKKTGKNAHDDAPDALTGTIEKRGSQPQKLNRIFR